MSERLVIQSHKGPYTVYFQKNSFQSLSSHFQSSFQSHFLIDSQVAELYSKELNEVLEAPSVLRILATEANKSLHSLTAYIEHLVDKKIRRGDQLIAIGGGMIQDITCFLAATLLRGLEWQFYPTTLLAQADSCIGSKSSINVGDAKNLIGTFTPPTQVVIGTEVLATLKEEEMRSGIGEMLKIHLIDGFYSFKKIASDYSTFFIDQDVLLKYVFRSLEIKRRFIEADEFDRGTRNLLNYGHSFGHALESATNFFIPHGIAVTLGMDLANYLSFKLGKMSLKTYEFIHFVLAQNYRGFEKTPVSIDLFLSALSKDKKNISDQLVLILVDESGQVSRHQVRKSPDFIQICTDFLLEGRVK